MFIKYEDLMENYIKKAKENGETDEKAIIDRFLKEEDEGKFNEILGYTQQEKAYDLYDEAVATKSKTRKIKLLNEALELRPDFFDATLLLIDIETNTLIRDKRYEEELKKEKIKLMNEGYFAKENIGHFYAIFETRPYIRGMYYRAVDLLYSGKYNLAKEICLEILKLNKNDNMGARYLLMAIYAILEEGSAMQKLYKKYTSPNIEMTFPMMIYYYKQNNYEKAYKYLDKIDEWNPNFVKYFEGTVEKKDKAPDGYYTVGGSSEVLMYFESYSFFTKTIPNIKDFVLNNERKSPQK